MRADARRSHERLLTAATEAFAEKGADAPLEAGAPDCTTWPPESVTVYCAANPGFVLMALSSW